MKLKKPTFPASGVRGWYEKQKQKAKEKDERARALEPTSLRILSFILTLTSMMLALSFLPLFPQPLPTVLAFLIAIVTWRSPRFGMPVGGLMVGLGLIYHLSRLSFISMLGGMEVRVAVIVVWMVLFVALPAIFARQEDAIAINLGIMASMLLFFTSTYFLAIPIIMASVVLFKKTRVALTVVYYVLLSVPLQIMQYYNLIFQIERSDWWLDPTSAPALFVPLDDIFKEIQSSMVQFRLYETSKVADTIVGQIQNPPPDLSRTLGNALTQYLDSFPGILLFIVIVVGVVSAFILISQQLSKDASFNGNMIFPSLTAAAGTIMFYMFALILQGPLAFRTEIDVSKLIVGAFAAILLTLPPSLVNYSPKKRAAIKARLEIIRARTQELTTRLQVFEGLLNKVKENIPVTVSSIEGKMLIIKDELNNTLSKTSASFYDISELEAKFNDIDKGITELMDELDVTLREYQVLVNTELSSWTGKFKDMGLQVNVTTKTDFAQDTPIETRIDQIKETLEGSKLFANEVTKVTTQIYESIRSLYDPTLPEKSETIEFVQQKLEANAVWIGNEALFSAINNWRKQYGASISKSVEHLQKSLVSMASLRDNSEKLSSILGANLQRLLDDTAQAEEIRSRIGNTAITVLNVMALKEALQSSISIMGDVFSVIYAEIKRQEDAIESLLPTKDYLWDRNVTLKQRLASALEIVSNPSESRLDQAVENLPKFLSYIDECVGTMILYKGKEELLLNYPTAKIAIEDTLKQKKRVSPADLPFTAEPAEEYLRLFYSERFGEFSFDETGITLTKKA